MRNLKIAKREQRDLPKMGILTNVVELSYYNMIYVHHLLDNDTTLELHFEDNHIFDNHAIEVYYKGVKIGYVSNRVNSIISRHIRKGMTAIAKVRNIKRNKFNPVGELEIQVLLT